jgi:hypothetical protein
MVNSQEFSEKNSKKILVLQRVKILVERKATCHRQQMTPKNQRPAASRWLPPAFKHEIFLIFYIPLVTFYEDDMSPFLF